MGWLRHWWDIRKLRKSAQKLERFDEKLCEQREIINLRLHELETKGGIECETPIFKMEKLLRDIDLARGRIENVLNLLAKVKDET
jgi:hypothetical protein